MIIPMMFKIFSHEVLLAAILYQNKTESLINYNRNKLIKNCIINYFTHQLHVAYHPIDYPFTY